MAELDAIHSKGRAYPFARQPLGLFDSPDVGARLLT